MKKGEIKDIILGALCIPFGFVLFYIYAKVVTYFDPLISLVIGGGFLIAVILLCIRFFNAFGYFIYSVFKKDRGVDKNGFKKF